MNPKPKPEIETVPKTPEPILPPEIIPFPETVPNQPMPDISPPPDNPEIGPIKD